MISVRPFSRSQRAAASEQRMGGFGIVDRLEHSEAADVGFPLPVVVRIVARQDSAHGFAAANRDELRRIAVLIERMFAAVEKRFHFAQSAAESNADRLHRSAREL